MKKIAIYLTFTMLALSSHAATGFDLQADFIPGASAGASIEEGQWAFYSVQENALETDVDFDANQRATKSQWGYPLRHAKRGKQGYVAPPINRQGEGIRPGGVGAVALYPTHKNPPPGFLYFHPATPDIATVAVWQAPAASDEAYTLRLAYAMAENKGKNDGVSLAVYKNGERIFYEKSITESTVKEAAIEGVEFRKGDRIALAVFDEAAGIQNDGLYVKATLLPESVAPAPEPKQPEQASVAPASNYPFTFPEANPPKHVFGVDTITVGGPLAKTMADIRKNILAVDWDASFLSHYKNQQAPDHNKYIGIGKALIGIVYSASYSQDPDMIQLKEHIIDELIATQEADGYIGLFQPQMRGMKKAWDFHEAAYMIDAFVYDYVAFGNEASLSAAEKLAACFMGVWETDGAPPLGFDNAILLLAKVTGNEHYARFIDENYFPGGEFTTMWDRATVRGDNIQQMLIGNEVVEVKEDPVLEGEAPQVDPTGRHCYNFMSASTAMNKLHHYRPDPHLLEARDAVIRYIQSGGAMAPGLCAWHEAWTKSQLGRDGIPNPMSMKNMAKRNSEACVHAYTMFFLDEMIRQEPKAYYGDWGERVLFNAVRGTQSPDGDHLRYSLAMEGQRYYYLNDTFCCPNNHRRGVSRIPGYFYYPQEDGVYINLYSESAATMQVLDGLELEIEQETRYPLDGKVRIILTPEHSETFALRLRIPHWAEGATVAVNDGAPEAVKDGTIHSIEREWRPGDEVLLDLPMKPRWVAGRLEQKGRAALAYGPLVFTLNTYRNTIPGYVDIASEADAERPGYNYGRLLGNLYGPNGLKPEAAQEEFRDWYRSVFKRDYPDYEASYQILEAIILDPGTLEGPFPDDSLGTDGVAFKVKAWSNAEAREKGPHDLDLELTEFYDPEGRKVHFLLSEDTLAQDDELLTIFPPTYEDPLTEFLIEKNGLTP